MEVTQVHELIVAIMILFSKAPQVPGEEHERDSMFNTIQCSSLQIANSHVPLLTSGLQMCCSSSVNYICFIYINFSKLQSFSSDRNATNK